MNAPTPVEALRKILELEAQKRYNDSAVIGGIDAYLATTRPHLPQTLGPAIRKVRSAPAGYRGWTQEQRKKWVSGTLDLLNRPQRRDPPPERQPVTVLSRVSIKTAALFARLGISTIDDLLHHMPRRYLDYTQTRPIGNLVPHTEQTVVGRVVKVSVVMPGGRRSTEAVIADRTGSIRILWFNQPWVSRQLPRDSEIVVSGTVSVFHNRLQFISPEWEDVETSGIHTGRLVPVYPLTKGVTARKMRNWVTEALDLCEPGPDEYLPADLLQRVKLPRMAEAVRQAHFPDSTEQAASARQRLAFNELLSLQLGLLITRRQWQHSLPGHPLKADPALLGRLMQMLPFTLTSTQQQTLDEILKDLEQPVPMSRMLQGDVGSGKTVVAFAAMLITAAHSFQAALMAPTEVLAEQHYRTLLSLLRANARHTGNGASGMSGDQSLRDDPVRSVDGVLDRPLTIALLTGSLTAARRRQVREQLASGDVDIVVGTQALVQEGVEFRNLALAVVDEQHRFGVLQRGGLRQKGYNPHVLVMTATPIPRSLALTVYGDLDLSTISELPPGRQQIQTAVFEPEDTNLAYRKVREEVEKGRQAYVICPLISESDKLAVRAATEEHEHLSHTVFPELRLGLLHGSMKSADKDAVMRRFRDGDLDILVSTTVIEVGIDVPNATVMVVLGAERFGLSQLHQLRGRVGRGSEKSYCLLVGNAASPDAQRRLAVLEKTHDGFELARHDLDMRGAGDFLGTQQSGLPPLRVAKLTDLSTMESARAEAQRLARIRGLLRDPAYAEIRQRVAALWNANVEWS